MKKICTLCVIKLIVTCMPFKRHNSGQTSRYLITTIVTPDDKVKPSEKRTQGDNALKATIHLVFFVWSDTQDIKGTDTNLQIKFGAAHTR